MPQLGESVVEGTVGKWLKAEGDAIEQYEPLLEIITDKVNAEYPSPVTGTLSKILVPEGETVDVDTPIAEIAAQGEAGEEPTPIEPELETAQMQPTSQSVAETAREDEHDIAAQVETIESEGRAAAPATPATENREESGKRYSPAVRRLAQEHDLDLTQIAGTGAGGRVSKQDVEGYLERLAAQPTQTETPTPEIAQLVTQAPPPSIQRPAAVEDEDRLVLLSPMRRAIAEHMVRSAFTSPHVTTVIEVDMTRIVRYREGAKAAFQQREGVSLTYLPFVIQAVVEGLKEHPVLNSTWTDQGIVLKKHINIGIAVGMEDGLIVPVVKDADEKSLVGLARAVADLAARARGGKLSPQDVQGGTFTVNNPGTFGTLVSTPIIHQPQAGILSMEAVVKRPVVVEDDAIAVRSMMYMSLSIDHRVLDGLQAARFLQSIKARLEGFSPESVGQG